MTRGRRLGLAGLSGILLALSFPKPALAFLAFIALAPLLVSVHGASRRHGFVYGQVAGTAQGCLLLSWVGDVLLQYGGSSFPVSLLLTLILSLAFGLFLGAFGALQAHMASAFGSRALLFSPFLFVTAEFLREHLLFGFPWCLLGYSQVDFTEMVQVAAFTAVHGVSFLLAASAAGLAHAILTESASERRFGLTLPALLISGAMAFGHGRLQQPLAQGAALTVGIVQASIPQDQKWESSLLQSNLERHLSLSEEAVQRDARLIVWPESAIGYELDLYPEVKKQIAGFAEKAGIFLMTGNDDRERDPSGRMRSYVGAKVISPSGDIAMRYHKIRLVPFGEYLPLPAALSTMLHLERLVESVSDFTPGSTARTTQVMGASVGAFICYEAIFPSLVRRFPLGGAQVLFNLTNDGWYGTSAAPYQHYAMARFRAIENHRFLVRAANTGISAIIDPFGRELVRSDLMESRVLVGEVRAISELTFYTRYGDVFAWTAALIAAVALLAAFLKPVPSHKLPLS